MRILFFLIVVLMGFGSCHRKLSQIPPIVPPKNDTSTRVEKTKRIDTIRFSDPYLVIQYLDTTKCPPSVKDTFIISQKNCKCPSIEIKTTETTKIDSLFYIQNTEQFYSCLVQNDSLKAQIIKKDSALERAKKQFNILLKFVVVVFLLTTLIAIIKSKWKILSKLKQLLRLGT
jgi:hypothetical protein